MYQDSESSREGVPSILHGSVIFDFMQPFTLNLMLRLMSLSICFILRLTIFIYIDSFKALFASFVKCDSACSNATVSTEEY